MPTLNQQQRDELQELYERTTRDGGEWKPHHRISPRGAYKQWHIGNDQGQCQITMSGREADYAFIAAAHNAMPALLATLDEKDAIIRDPKVWMKWCDIRVLEDNESLRATLAEREATGCSVCKAATDMACADCRINLQTTVYVCPRSECRDRHESNCTQRLKEKADAEMERVKACEHIAEGDEGWEQLTNLCPSTAAVATLRAELQQANERIRELETCEHSVCGSAPHHVCSVHAQDLDAIIEQRARENF